MKINLTSILIIIIVILGLVCFLSIRSCTRQKDKANTISQTFIASNHSLEQYVDNLGDTVTRFESIKVDNSTLKKMLNDTCEYYTSKYAYIRLQMNANDLKAKDIILALNAQIKAQNELIGDLSNNVFFAEDNGKVFSFSDGYLNANVLVSDTMKLRYTYIDNIVLLKKLVRNVRSNGKPYFWLWRWIMGKHDVYEIHSTNKNSSVPKVTAIEVIR